MPGKILSKQSISRNGYKGFDIINRTRRRDHQRYHIFITPAEILLFKMSGIGDYVTDSTIANRFFSSIELKEIVNSWQTYQPATGGFEVVMPHDPFVQKSSNWQYTALDKTREYL